MPNSNADKPNSRPLALSSCSLPLIDSRASVLLLSDWSHTTRPQESCPIRLKELFESDLMLESDLSHSGLGLLVSCRLGGHTKETTFQALDHCDAYQPT